MLTVSAAVMRLSSIPYLFHDLFQHLHTLSHKYEIHVIVCIMLTVSSAVYMYLINKADPDLGYLTLFKNVNVAGVHSSILLSVFRLHL